MRRYGQLAKSVQQTMEMMRSGMAKNITAHSASMEVRKKTKHLKKTYKMTKHHFPPTGPLWTWCRRWKIFLESYQAVPGQIESHLTGEVEESVLFKPFKDLQEKSNLSETEVARLQAGAKTIIKSEIRPAFRKLLRLRNYHIGDVVKIETSPMGIVGKLGPSCQPQHESTGQVHLWGILCTRFISEEYQPSCRTNIAASSLPGGQFYQACIRCIFTR